MKMYVIATGVVFGLLTLVHVWRMVEEPRLATDPWFLLTTALSAGLCLSAWYVVRRRSPSP